VLAHRTSAPSPLVGGQVSEGDEIQPLVLVPQSLAKCCSLSESISAILNSVTAKTRNSGVVKPVGQCLQSGQAHMSQLIRGLQSPNLYILRAATSLCYFLATFYVASPEFGGASSQLHMLCAEQLSVVARSPDGKASGSTDGFDFNLEAFSPSTAREARRSRAMHPEGQSLFARDVVKAKLDCLLALLAVQESAGSVVENISANFQFQSTGASLSTSIGDLVFIAEASFAEAERYTKEGARLRESGYSMTSSRRVSAMKAFCVEEYDTNPSDVGPSELHHCLSLAADGAASTASTCLTILEYTLGLIRELGRHATAVVQDGEDPHLRCRGVDRATALSVLGNLRGAMQSLCTKVSERDLVQPFLGFTDPCGRLTRPPKSFGAPRTLSLQSRWVGTSARTPPSIDCKGGCGRSSPVANWAQFSVVVRAVVSSLLLVLLGGFLVRWIALA